MSFKAGFKFRNEDFKPEYEDLKNPITKTFVDKIEETVSFFWFDLFICRYYFLSMKKPKLIDMILKRKGEQNSVCKKSQSNISFL